MPRYEAGKAAQLKRDAVRFLLEAGQHPAKLAFPALSPALFTALFTALGAVYFAGGADERYKRVAFCIEAREIYMKAGQVAFYIESCKLQ